MTTRWVTPDGGRVDVINLTGTGKAGHDGSWLRVTGSHGNYAGQVRTPAELAQFDIILADLTPARPREKVPA